MGKKIKVNDLIAFEDFNKHLGKTQYQHQLIARLIDSVITGKCAFGDKLYEVINLIMQADEPPETWHILTNLPGFVEVFDKMNKDEKVSASHDDANPRPNSVLLIPLAGSWNNPAFDDFNERFAQAFPDMKVMRP